MHAQGPFPGITIVFEHMAANRDLYLAIFRTESAASSKETLQDYVVQSMTPILQTLLQKHGINEDEADIEPIAYYLAGSLRGLSRWWLEYGMAKSSAQISTLFLQLLSKGLESLR